MTSRLRNRDRIRIQFGDGLAEASALEFAAQGGLTVRQFAENLDRLQEAGYLRAVGRWRYEATAPVASWTQ